MAETPKDAAERLKREGKNVLNLIIKQVYFDQILAGTKKTEYRELKPSTVKKLVETDENGDYVFDEEEHCIPLHYDALLLFVGYNKVRDSALVEVTDAQEEYFYDQEGNIIYHEFEDGEKFYPSQIAYSLGKVIAKEVHKK